MKTKKSAAKRPATTRWYQLESTVTGGAKFWKVQATSKLDAVRRHRAGESARMGYTDPVIGKPVVTRCALPPDPMPKSVPIDYDTTDDLRALTAAESLGEPKAVARVRLYGQLRELWAVVEDNVSRDFDRQPTCIRAWAHHLKDCDEYIPTTAEMLEIKTGFFGLPEAERLRLVNGWKASSEPGTIDDVLMADQDANQFLLVRAWQGRVTGSLEPMLYSGMGTTVMVSEGTHKADVIRDLLLIIDRLRTDFERFINPPDDNPVVSA